MSEQEIPSVINPEVPETPEGKLQLLQKCLAAIAAGSEVAVNPNHVSQEGMHMIKQERKRVARQALEATDVRINGIM